MGDATSPCRPRSTAVRHRRQRCPASALAHFAARPELIGQGSENARIATPRGIAESAHDPDKDSLTQEDVSLQLQCHGCRPVIQPIDLAKRLRSTRCRPRLMRCRSARDSCRGMPWSRTTLPTTMNLHRGSERDSAIGSGARRRCGASAWLAAGSQAHLSVAIFKCWVSALRSVTPRRGARPPVRFGLRIVCAEQLEYIEIAIYSKRLCQFV